MLHSNCSIITTIINQLTCWNPRFQGFFGRAKTTTFKGDPAVFTGLHFSLLSDHAFALVTWFFHPKDHEIFKRDFFRVMRRQQKCLNRNISNTHHTIHGWCVWYIYIPTFGWFWWYMKVNTLQKTNISSTAYNRHFWVDACHFSPAGICDRSLEVFFGNSPKQFQKKSSPGWW